MTDVLVENSEREAVRPFVDTGILTGQAGRAIASLKALLPFSRERFEIDFAAAMKAARGHPGEFYLPNYIARRALRDDLLIDIDPQPVKERLRHRLRGSRTYLQDRFLGSGDWRPLLVDLEGSHTHRDVQEVVRARFDYRATKGYHTAISRANGSNPAERNFVALKSPALVERYFRRVSELCQSIERDGLRRRSERRWLPEAFRQPRVRLPWVELAEANVGVAIGANGEVLHFGCGKHRIAAAKALGLTRIPVEARMVHVAWVARQIDERGLAPLDALIQGIRSLDLRGSEGG